MQKQRVTAINGMTASSAISLAWHDWQFCHPHAHGGTLISAILPAWRDSDFRHVQAPAQQHFLSRTG
ncbi:hypothetical protein L195_g061801, partial [Trifolium pratense]